MTTSIVISLAALVVALYGVIERRSLHVKSERLRLMQIIAELNDVSTKFAEVPDLRRGNLVEAYNTKREVLSWQALALLNEFSTSITSSECRVLAFALEGVGDADRADEIWRLAIDTARTEDSIQRLAAHRGYAFFLFRYGNLDDAREEIGRSLEANDLVNDAQKKNQIDTLLSWAVWESKATDDTSTEVEEILAAAVKIGEEVEYSGNKKFMREIIQETRLALANVSK